MQLSQILERDENKETPAEERTKQALGEIELDTALFIRMLEYAKEEAKTDMDLHKVTEKIQLLYAKHGMLTMAHYNEIMATVK